MKRSTKGLLLLLAALPVAILVFGTIYMLLMEHLEGEHRTLLLGLEWAAETLSTTGYGIDSQWKHPITVAFVIFVQFFGVFLIFLIFPIYIIPFLEERFELRLPSTLPAPKGERYILIYRYGPAVSVLIDELARHGRRTVIIEEDDIAARRLYEQGLEVVRIRHTLDDLHFDDIEHAEAIVANGSDHDNATLLHIVRGLGFKGPVFVRVDDAMHRQPLITWGATDIYTPVQALAQALASKTSRRINAKIQGVQQLGEHLGVAELRIHPSSPLVGDLLEQTTLRKRHGLVVLGKYRNGRFTARLPLDSRLAPRDIIVVAGRKDALEGLGRLAVPLAFKGPVLIAGYGSIGRQVRRLLKDAGEETLVVDQSPLEGVDVVGNVLDQETLEQADIKNARAIVLTLGHDSECLFAAMVVRDVAPDVPLIVRVNETQGVSRLYRIGVDFALSVGQVAGQYLAQHLLGEQYIGLEDNLKLVSLDSAGLVGQHPLQGGVKERTNCEIVAIERENQVIVEFTEDFRIADTDRIYLVGSQEALDEYYSAYPNSSPESLSDLDET